MRRYLVLLCALLLPHGAPAWEGGGGRTLLVGHVGGALVLLSGDTPVLVARPVP